MWLNTLQFFVIITLELVALFILISMVVALINRRFGDERLQRWLAGGYILGPLKGILLGMITPFCSCSTLPMLVGMLKAKVPFITAAAFLLASPLLNPIVIVALFILFGWQISVGYVALIIALTVVMAGLWQVFGFEKFVKKVRLKGVVTHQPWQGFRKELPGAWQTALSTLKPLLLPLLIGVLIGALIYGVVPTDFIQTIVGNHNAFAIPIAAVIGIPLYVRIEAILPVGLALHEAGMGIGAIFALIIGSAGASIPEVSMLTGIFKPPLVILFLVTVLAIAIASGYLLPMFV